MIKPVYAKNKPESIKSVSDKFCGELLVYELDFFLFKGIAECRINLKFDEKSQLYQAVMQAKGKGVMGWLTNYRIQQYSSYMQPAKDGKRMQPVSFEKTIIKSEMRRKSCYWFDYPQKIITCTSFFNDNIVGQYCIDIPKGKKYEDILTVFYNFRAGVFGEVKKGRKYIIPALPFKGVDKFLVIVLNKENEQTLRRDLDWQEQNTMLLNIRVGKEIFNTKDGFIKVLLSDDMLPLKGVAENVVSVGDITGRLIKHVYSPDKN